MSISTDSEHGTATPPAPGDLIFVYGGGPGLATRLEGWALSVLEMHLGDGPEATRDRKVAVFQDRDGALDISAFITPLAAVETAWHLVSPAGDIVNGGPRGLHGAKPSQTPGGSGSDPRLRPLPLASGRGRRPRCAPHSRTLPVRHHRPAGGIPPGPTLRARPATGTTFKSGSYVQSWSPTVFPAAHGCRDMLGNGEPP